MSEFNEPMDLGIPIKNEALTEELEKDLVDYQPDEVDKIRVVLYKDGKVFDSFSIKAKPKSKLCQRLVKVVDAIRAKRDGR